MIVGNVTAAQQYPCMNTELQFIQNIAIPMAVIMKGNYNSCKLTLMSYVCPLELAFAISVLWLKAAAAAERMELPVGRHTSSALSS